VKAELQMKPGSEFLHYASLYREALNSNSAIYRFLCLFKIIEGIIARRNRIATEVVKSGGKPRSLVERIPADAASFQKVARCYLSHSRLARIVRLDKFSRRPSGGRSLMPLLILI